MDIENKRDRLLSVEFTDQTVRICFQHHIVETWESAESRRRRFQEIFTQRTGREIPFESVEVRPEAGERWRAKTCFVTKLEGGLYVGIYRISHEDPASLVGLADHLRTYKEAQGLPADQSQLLGYVIGELDRLVTPKNKE